VRLGRWCQLALALALTVALQVGLVTVVLWGALQTATPAAWQDLWALQNNLTRAPRVANPMRMWCGSAPSCNVRQAAMERVKAAVAAVPSSWAKNEFNNTGRELFSGTCSVVFNSSTRPSDEDLAPLGDPRCYLCSLAEANSSDCNITAPDEHGTPRRLSCVSLTSRDSDVASTCITMLNVDIELTSLLRFQLLKYYANPDDDRTQAEVMQSWPFAALPVNDSAWDISFQAPWSAPPPSSLPGAFGVAVSFAVVLIAINVHKELCRAHLLARLALTHSRCMPAFFAPLAELPLTPPGAVTAPPLVWRFVAALCMLALPIVQICVAVYVLFCASLVYELASETKDIISVIYNSAALLCVLELDNYMGAMIGERLGTLFPLQGHQTDHLELSQPSPSPPRPAAAAVGYAYNALLGALAIAEVVAAVMPLLDIVLLSPKPPTGLDTLQHNLNNFRGTGPACIAFGVLYTAAVALLFDAPLPPAQPGAWSACTKLALVALAATGAASRYLGNLVLSSAFLYTFNILVMASWLACMPSGHGHSRATRVGAPIHTRHDAIGKSVADTE
jgi:hypothetical protein